MSIFISTFTFLILSISVLLISASFILPSVPLFLGLLSQMCIPAFRPFIHQPPLSLIPPPLRIAPPPSLYLPVDSLPHVQISLSTPHSFPPAICSSCSVLTSPLLSPIFSIYPSICPSTYSSLSLSIYPPFPFLFVSLIPLLICPPNSVPPTLLSYSHSPESVLHSLPLYLSGHPSLLPLIHPSISLSLPHLFSPPSTCSPGPVPSFILPRLSPPQELRRVRLLCQSCQSEPRLRRTWDPCFVDKLFGD